MSFAWPWCPRKIHLRYLNVTLLLVVFPAKQRKASETKDEDTEETPEEIALEVELEDRTEQVVLSIEDDSLGRIEKKTCRISSECEDTISLVFRIE